jgi:hypothetical protein
VTTERVSSTATVVPIMQSMPRSLRALAALAVLTGGLALAGCLPSAPAVVSCSNPWRGYVVASDHNYAGIGAFNGSNRYMCKDTPTQGVRAHLQHLYNYATPGSTAAALTTPFEPRPFYDAAAFDSFVYKGQAPLWVQLNGKWAVPGTTYAQGFINNICNPMRNAAVLPPLDVNTVAIHGTQDITAVQMAAWVRHSINMADWKPEISPEDMAQIYLNEGAGLGIRGDIAFCQSILETGWFRWPGSPASTGAGLTTEDQQPDPVMDAYFELQHVTARY